MQQIAQLIDQKDADCLYLVGGDGTICHVLTGIFQHDKNDESKLPIGVFPGGWQNKSFKILDFVHSNTGEVMIII
jgi:diacylglycerol kinase family enzyme